MEEELETLTSGWEERRGTEVDLEERLGRDLGSLMEGRLERVDWRSVGEAGRERGGERSQRRVLRSLSLSFFARDERKAKLTLSLLVIVMRVVRVSTSIFVYHIEDSLDDNCESERRTKGRRKVRIESRPKQRRKGKKESEHSPR